MIVRIAAEQDFPGFLGLAAQVEHWFGPMVEDPGFHHHLHNNIRRSTALVAVSSDPGLLGGLFFGADHPGAVASGARAFYERLGFTPAEAADPGPEGGSRQVYRLAVI
ncbi:hypothetical protein ACFPOI_30465 [Nonomuraea angiospora]|uniref:GNAT family N-acetyltransferase n=1 Tax=Nonomuraea angiospora TaxID=46172 RepID=A0ABR9LUS9_9ACTN|nr:hypothetical protein [Nonomuraea angiospora]MBE1584401.1 hypothetical protein [Nonomuraea angiospora]